MKRKATSKPTVSVVLTTYDRAKLLAERSLPSVLAQTYSDWECIVVDDGSTDNTPQLMREFEKRDPRIRYVRLPVNRGLSPAANIGIRHAQGKFLSFLDSDDAYLPTFLEELLPRLEALPEEYGGVVGGAILVHPNGWQEFVVPKLDSFYTAVGNGIWLLRTIIFFRDNLFFDEEMESDADSDLGIRFFQKYKAMVLPKTVMMKYTHPMHIGSMSATPSPRRLASLEKFFSKYLAIFQAQGDKRELSHLYRLVGRNFCLGNNLARGREFLRRAFLTKPTLQNLANLIASCCGTWFYRQYWQLELLLSRFIRSHILRSQ